MKFHGLTIDQKILFMTRFIYLLLLYNMYNEIRNGIYKKLREFNFEIDPEINTGFQSQNSHQPVKWISLGKEKYTFCEKFYLCANLISALASLDVHNFSHVKAFWNASISARSFTRQLLTSKVGGGLWNTVYLTWRMYFQVHAVMTRESTLMHISKDPLNISPMR